MKKAIQILSFSLFISFTFPCFQMCSDASLLKRKHQETGHLEPETPTKTEQIKPTHLWKEKGNAAQIGWDEPRAEWTFTTYELALKSFQIDTVADLKERGIYPFLCITGVVLFTVLLCYQAVRQHFVSVFRISLINISLLVTAVGLWVYDKTLEELQQLKWGFYMVFITLVVLAVLSYLKKRKTLQ
ncbi:MAG: hypothetical protein ACOVP9_08435 [Flavobacterium stagni]